MRNDMRELKLKNGIQIIVKDKPYVADGVIEVEDMDGRIWMFPLTEIQYYTFK